MEDIKTLPREPWRGSQICGEQVAYGLPWDKFCAERKAPGKQMCPHHDLVYGGFPMPPNVARGDLSQPVRLLWEPFEGSAPVEPSAEELALYAPLFSAYELPGEA